MRSSSRSSSRGALEDARHGVARNVEGLSGQLGRRLELPGQALQGEHRGGYGRRQRRRGSASAQVVAAVERAGLVHPRDAVGARGGPLPRRPQGRVESTTPPPDPAVEEERTAHRRPMRRWQPAVHHREAL